MSFKGAREFLRAPGRVGPRPDSSAKQAPRNSTVEAMESASDADALDRGVLCVPRLASRYITEMRSGLGHL